MDGDRFLSRFLRSGVSSRPAGRLASALLTSKAGLIFGKRALRTTVVGALFVSCLAIPGFASGEPQALEDVELRARIEAKLAELPGREGAEIRVMVRNGQVLLQGRVRLLEQSLRAEQAAWKTSGVLDLENELRVVSPGVGGDAAIEQRIRMIIKGDERFIDTNLRLEVTAGEVRLRGLFQDPADVLALKHRIASIPGVLGVEIDAVLVARRGMPDRTRFS
jgi:osmotically-inducible protein OsmY